MNAADVVRRLHEHRMWANHHLLDSAAMLPEESLRRQFPIGQGSVWKSLTHLFAAEYVWLEALLGNETALAPGDVAGKLPGNQEGPGRFPLEGLRAQSVGAGRPLAELSGRAVGRGAGAAGQQAWPRPGSWPDSGCRPAAWTRCCTSARMRNTRRPRL